MKNDLTWTKTILTVYRYLERIAGGIDKIIMRSALSSSDISGQNWVCNNVCSVTERLIDLSDRKITLINLKLIVEQTLKDISKSDAQILIEKYFDNFKCKDMAEKREVSMRTIFRKISMAENCFFKRLHMKGFNDSYLNKMLKEEKWIFNVYNEISFKDSEQISFSQNDLAKAASL